MMHFQIWRSFSSLSNFTLTLTWLLQCSEVTDVWLWSHRCHAQWSVSADALDDPVEGVGEHKAKFSGVAVNCINLRPPVQMRLNETTQDGTLELTRCTQTTLSSLKCEGALQTYIGDYSVQ